MPSQCSMLCSSFTVAARPKASYPLLRHRLSSFCHLTPINTGTEIDYAVTIAEKGKPNPILSLRRNSIMFRFFFDSPSSVVYNQNFLIFVSLLPLITDFYEVSLDSIYTYIMEFASGSGYMGTLENKRSTALIEKRLSAISAINSTLSHELVRLSKELSTTSTNLESLKVFCAELIRSSKNMGITNTDKTHLFSSTFGISEAVVSRAIKVINNQG